MRMIVVAGLLTVALFVAVLGAVGAAPGLSPTDNARNMDGARNFSHQFTVDSPGRHRG